MKNYARRDQRYGFQRAESGSCLLRHAHIASTAFSSPPGSGSDYILTFLCQSAEGFSPERAQEGRKEGGVDKLPS